MPTLSLTKKLAFSLIMLLVTLLVCEGFTRVFFSLRDNLDIEMWKYSQRMKQRVDDPDLVFVHRPNTQAKLYGVDVSINARGLRGPDVAYARTPGTKRVVVVGDCMTFGWGVPFAGTCPEQLAQALTAADSGTRWEAVNLGSGNYNAVQQSALFAREGDSYDADLYVINYFLNDVEPTPVAEGNLLLENSMLSVFVWSRYQTLVRQLGYQQEYANYYQSLYDTNAPAYRAAWQAFGRMVSAMHRHGSPVVVNILPVINTLAIEQYPYRAMHEQAARELQPLGVTVVDTLDAFIGQDEKLLWVSNLDTHYNEKALALIVQKDVPVILPLLQTGTGSTPSPSR